LKFFEFTPVIFNPLFEQKSSACSETSNPFGSRESKIKTHGINWFKNNSFPTNTYIRLSKDKEILNVNNEDAFSAVYSEGQYPQILYYYTFLSEVGLIDYAYDVKKMFFVLQGLKFRPCSFLSFKDSRSTTRSAIFRYPVSLPPAIEISPPGERNTSSFLDISPAFLPAS